MSIFDGASRLVVLAAAAAIACIAAPAIAADAGTSSPQAKTPNAQASVPDADAKKTGYADAKKTDTPGRKKSPFRQAGQTRKAAETYRALWGVDKLSVEQTASGNLIRFKYRVIDPQLARPLGAKESAASLFNPRNRALLQVPVMDNVGQLRQTGTPKAGEEYWMTFSNKGSMVRPGDRVTVRIGPFRADGLLVL